MAFKHSDRPTEGSGAPVRLAELKASIESGNWNAAEAMAQTLCECKLPVIPEDLHLYLEELKRTVILAKSYRSVAAATLARVRAAERFQTGCSLTDGRQNFGDAAVFSQSVAPLPPNPSTT